MIFCRFLELALVLKNRILVNTEFVHYVTGRPNILTRRLSRREVKNDVWKYLQNTVIRLYAAVCGHLLDNQNRAHSIEKFHSPRMHASLQTL